MSNSVTKKEMLDLLDGEKYGIPKIGDNPMPLPSFRRVMETGDAIRALIEKYGGAEPDGGPTITESQLKEAIKTINFYKGTSQIDMREWLISIGVNVVEGEEKHEHQD